MRLLGIDYGEKRVGIAVSDESGTLAFPWAIFANNNHLAHRITDVCKVEKVEKIILGESKTYGGKENPLMQKIIHFKKLLEDATGLPVIFESEVLTTQEARRSREGGKGGKGGEEKNRPVDDSAAAIILQSYIDKVSRQS